MASGTQDGTMSPGAAILKLLEEYGWSQKDLADVLQIPAPKVSTLITGKRRVTHDVARQLASVFGTDMGYWLNLDLAHRSHDLFGGNPLDETLTRRSRLFRAAPVNEMIKRRWIQNTDDIDLLEKQVLGFYGTDSLDELTAKIPHAARKSGSYQTESAKERFWMQRVKQLAPAAPVTAKFTDASFAEAMNKFKGFLAHPESVRHIPKILADAGIRFVIVENLPQTGIDGVCVWLDKTSPVIAMSLFRDRLDSVWFTLFHEMDHVQNRDGLMLPPVVDSCLTGQDAISGKDKPESEQRADAFASTSLIPKSEMENFIVRIAPLYSKPRIVGFAKRLGVHPSIVLGQLQYRGEVGWSDNKDLVDRVRDILIHMAPTDGWGMGAILPAAV